MRKVYHHLRYFWFLLKHKELTLMISSCVDVRVKNKLEKKINHFEQAIFNYREKYRGAHSG